MIARPDAVVMGTGGLIMLMAMIVIVGMTVVMPM